MKNSAATVKPSPPSLRAVMEAQALLEEARGWWAWAWASPDNQARVRSAIEAATAALDREIAKARMSWNAGSPCRAPRSFKEAECEFNRATALAKKTFHAAQKEWNPAKAREAAALAKTAIQKHADLLALARSASNC